MVNKVFINLPVKNLKRAVDFYTALGFTTNNRFADENGVCIVISDSIYVMLLVEKFFNSFTKKAIVDTQSTSEVIIALSAKSRENVNELLEKAINAGGKTTINEDREWMVSKGFTDLDGHHLEIFFMDENNIPKQ